MGLTKTGMWIVCTFVIAFIYWEINRGHGAYLSDCHWADIKINANKVMCLECKKSCKLVHGWGNRYEFDIKIVNEVVEEAINE
tara:strand:+ start:419 stop:667 length:249 start_codon:yes stop_codon:yes gene_type:complete